MKKNKKGKEEKKKGFFNKKTLLIIISIIVVVTITIILLFSKSFARPSLSSPIDENKIEFTCNEYTSFDGKLKCRILVDLVPGAEISGVSVKLSKEPSSASKIADLYNEDSMVLNEGKYVDIMFANNLHDDGYGVAEDLAYVWFDSVDENEVITVEDVVYYDSHNAIYDLGEDTGVEPTILNAAESPMAPSYSLETIPTGPELLTSLFDSSQYLFIPNYSGDLYADVNEILTGDYWSMEGCQDYVVSEDGTSILIEDLYGNTKRIDVIYVGIKEGNNYTLPWGSTENIYTRSAETESQLKQYIFDTNGNISTSLIEGNYYISIFNNDFTFEISKKNWYFVKGMYNFTPGVINIPGTITYDDFMDDLVYNGVTVQGVASCGDDSCGAASGLVSGQSLEKHNRLDVTGVPGIGTDTIYINTTPGFEIYVFAHHLEIDSENNNEYVIFDLQYETFAGLLHKIQVSNGYFMLLDVNDNVKVEKMNFADIESNIISLSDMRMATGDKLIIHSASDNDEFIYHLSVLGDLDGNGIATFSDVIKSYKMYKNTTTFTEAQKLAADVVRPHGAIGHDIDVLDIQRLYGFFRKKYSTLRYDIEE